MKKFAILACVAGIAATFAFVSTAAGFSISGAAGTAEKAPAKYESSATKSEYGLEGTASKDEYNQASNVEREPGKLEGGSATKSEYGLEETASKDEENQASRVEKTPGKYEGSAAKTEYSSETTLGKAEKKLQ